MQNRPRLIETLARLGDLPFVRTNGEADFWSTSDCGLPRGSNNDFSLFEEMDLASKLAKVTTMNPRALKAQTVFEMATIMGAQAVGMDKEIGSLEAGKRADMITVSTNEPNAWPPHDPYSMLVFTLKASNVQDVVIEGKATIENKRPLTLNPELIRREAAAIRQKVEASIK